MLKIFCVFKRYLHTRYMRQRTDKGLSKRPREAAGEGRGSRSGGPYTSMYLGQLDSRILVCALDSRILVRITYTSMYRWELAEPQDNVEEEPGSKNYLKSPILGMVCFAQLHNYTLVTQIWGSDEAGGLMDKTPILKNHQSFLLI